MSYRINQRDIYEWAKNHGNNVVTRNLQETCYDLYNFDKYSPNTVRFPKLESKFSCYGCNKLVRQPHAVYLFSCFKCGSKFQQNRNLSRDLTGQIALVIGSRTKLGHQCVVKLLNAGANVICTTRFPEKALELYKKYDEYKVWKERLHVYMESLDLDTDDISLCVSKLYKYIDSIFGKLDILVISAAQTIRYKEKETVIHTESNRYGDTKHVPVNAQNSWDLTLSEITQKEIEEVFRINSVAPLIITQQLIPLMEKSDVVPYIINVHAREGLFNVSKSDKHIHTNMGKAGLAMLTKCLNVMKLKTYSGKKFSIHGCDPGWISVDEYYKESSPWIVPPLDEIDGASRILFPLFKNNSSCEKTRRHYSMFSF